MMRLLLILLAFQVGQAQAEPKCSMSLGCTFIDGLTDYLNGSGSEPSLANKDKLRTCLKDVRTSNRILLAGSKPGCTTADDQAFKLLLKLGQEEIREYQARQAKPVDDIVFEDKPCFGSLCYQTNKGWAGRYNPNHSAQGAN